MFRKLFSFSILILGLGVQLNAFAQTTPHTRAELPQFYRRVLSAGMSSNFSSIQIRYLDDADLEDMMAHHPEWLGGSLWEFSMYPDTRMRMQGWWSMMNRLGQGFEQPLLDFLSTPNARRRILEDSTLSLIPANSTSPGAEEYLKTLKESSTPFAEQSSHSDLAKNKLVQKAACLRLDPAHVEDCFKALGIVMEFMSPVGAGYSAVPLMEKVLADPTFTEGAAHAAIKIMNAVEEYQASGSVSGLAKRDLMDDLVRGYLEAGLSHELATEHAWDLLGLYGTRGANIEWFLLRVANSKTALKTVLALQTIATGASVLDSLTAGSGTLYSLPKGIRTVANYGKVYHFWLSAYLTRMLALRHGITEGGATAVALGEIAYQALSETAGREGFFDQIVGSAPDAVAVRKVQTDLAFSIAASEYAAFKDPAVHIDVDEAVLTVVNYQRNRIAFRVENAIAGRVSPFVQKLSTWAEKIHPLTLLQKVRSGVCASITSGDHS